MKIDFQLLGTDVLPKEISRRTGIRPHTEFARGERNPRLDLPRLNVWSIESCVNSDEILDHWAQLGPTLLEAKEEIREIAKSGKAMLTVVIASTERLPSLQIPPAMSAFAGFVNAIIDIDQLQ
jgi:hypothetical protein